MSDTPIPKADPAMFAPCPRPVAGEPANTQGDQHGIGHRAEQRHRKNVIAQQALPQNKGILRADGDNQAAAKEKAGNRRRKQAYAALPLEFSRLSRYSPTTPISSSTWFSKKWLAPLIV